MATIVVRSPRKERYTGLPPLIGTEDLRQEHQNRNLSELSSIPKLTGDIRAII
jgi:hypothetical protein